ATTAEATIAAQEVQTASDTTRAALRALQAKEADLQDIVTHPLDHISWPAASGVDFAVGTLSGGFGSIAIAPDEHVLVTSETAGVVLRDSRTGDARQTLSVQSTPLAVAPTGDGKVWTLTRDNTIALRDPATSQVLWQWQDVDYTLSAMTATRDGSLV